MSAAEQFPKGTLIDGRYDIREHLGQGGMGSVYRVYDTKVGQMVALKMVADGGSEKSREDRRMRFAREIVAINNVRHPNVLHIQEFGFHKDTPYMVMEWLDGRDLAAVLKESQGPLVIEYAIDIMVAVCAAIRACHDSDVIHRDLKPGNIMIVKRDVGAGWDVKVVDFGISKTAGISEITETGKIVGTPHFLSPEQIGGEVGPASDQYAIGVLLYVCLTRRHPFAEFEGLPLVRAIEKGVFKSPREHNPAIPEELERIVLKAMHLEPAKRYGSVFHLGRELWNYASPLGRQFWKRYYETPPVERPKNDASMSTVGVSLARRIADGEVSLTPATVQAHYQSTTAVQVDGVTLDQPSATLAREASGGPTQMTLHTPSGWKWDKESSKSRAPTAAERPSTKQRIDELRRTTRIIVAAAAACAVVLIAVGATRLATKRSPAARPTAAAASSAMAPSPVAQAIAPAPVAPIAVPPTAVLPVAPLQAVDKKPADEMPAGEEPPPARKSHRRGHARERATAEWLTDPAGNPIAPP